MPESHGVTYQLSDLSETLGPHLQSGKSSFYLARASETSEITYIKGLNRKPGSRDCSEHQRWYQNYYHDYLLIISTCNSGARGGVRACWSGPTNGHD